MAGPQPGRARRDAQANPSRLVMPRSGWPRPDLDVSHASSPDPDLERVIADTRADRVIITSPDLTHADTYNGEAHGLRLVVSSHSPSTRHSADRGRSSAPVGKWAIHSQLPLLPQKLGPERADQERIGGEALVGDLIEWVLDTAHGADYFRRWHRDKTYSG